MTSAAQNFSGRNKAVTPPIVGTLFSTDGDTGKALPRHAREHNRSLIVRTLYAEGPQSRADLARATGLAKVTVSDLVAELIDSGLVNELGTRKPKGPGKPAVIVDIAWDAFSIVAVDLSQNGVFRSSLVTLDATPTFEIMVPAKGQKGEEALELLLELIRGSITQADRPVLGIGIGTPGLVTPDGKVVVAPNLGWKDVPLREVVREAFDLPTSVVNDADMAALGQDLFEETAKDFILVTVGQGIGAGLIANRTLVQGSGHAVGEIGQVDVEDGNPPGYKYDPSRVLERWLAVPELEERLQKAQPQDREAVLREAGGKLGRALAPIIAVLDLSEVILAGPADLLEGPLVDETTRVIIGRVLPEITENLTIKVNEDTHRLVMLGCTSQVLASLFGVERRQPARSSETKNRRTNS